MRRLVLLALCAVGCELPPDQVVLRPGGGVDLSIAADAAVPARGSGYLRITALDDETGLPIPARVIISPVLTTPVTPFDVGSDGRSVDGEYGVSLGPGVIGAPEGVFLVAGDGGFPIPSGAYDLFTIHGPEWEGDLARVFINDGQTASHVAMLRHSVDTRGWLAADLHLHTGRSFDSMIQVEDRVVTEVASGIEVIVTSDHNVLTELQPQIEAFGYHRMTHAVVGDEVSFLEGHAGAFPLPFDATDPLTGGIAKLKLDLPSVKDLHSTDLFAWLRGQPSKPVVIVNHPRLEPGLGYFDNIGWAPPAALPDNGLLDGLEILNGFMNAPGDLAMVLRDWFFLLDGGTRVVGVGSSDSHRLRDVKAGYPRTWIRLPTDEPSQLVDADLSRALLSQAAIASNGPFALLTVDDAQIGDQVTDKSGMVTIDALVDAPDWIDVATVRLFVNGRVAQVFPVAAGLRPLFHVRFHQALPPGDAWVALQADGMKPLPIAIIGEHEAGRVLPFVITNPVFVDGDGDGKWHPTIPDPDPGPIDLGLPPPPPGTEGYMMERSALIDLD
jgi:hypothetical protein